MVSSKLLQQKPSFFSPYLFTSAPEVRFNQSVRWFTEDKKALQDETQHMMEVSTSQDLQQRSSHRQQSKALQVSPQTLNVRNVRESPSLLGFRTGSHDEIDGRGDVTNATSWSDFCGVKGGTGT